MASAASALSERDNRDPDRPRITRRNRGDRGRHTPLDLEYLQRPSYCDAGFALEQISEVLRYSFSRGTREGRRWVFAGLCSPLNVLKSWPNCVRSLQGNGTGWGSGVVAGKAVRSPDLCSRRPAGPDLLAAQPACALSVNKLHLRGRTTRSLLVPSRSRTGARHRSADPLAQDVTEERN